MAQKPEIQYIQYPIDGSAARQLEPKLFPQRKVLPRPKPRQRKKPRLVLAIDPLVTAGLVVAAVMLVLILVGFSRLDAVTQQVEQMQGYVQTLSAENARLSAEYEAGCDLEDVAVKALALGMIPADEAQHITITLPVHEQVPEPTFWEKLSQSWKELFA